MVAVIELGGKQYNVSVGTKFTTEKIDLAEGKTFDVEKVLLVSDDAGQDCKIGMPLLKDQKVTIKVLNHGKGDKIRVFKMKAKKRYSRVQGHRQLFTEVEVVEIAGEKAKASVAPKTVAKPSTTPKKVDTIKSETKKPAVKKAVEKVAAAPKKKTTKKAEK